MRIGDFFGKCFSRYLWGHFLAMALVIILLCLGIKFGLEVYTHHGQGIEVPKLTGMTFQKARALLGANELRIMVSDSGYNKRLPADFILAQTPGPGTKVKEGHVVYVTVNSPSSPTFAIPDLIDNSSFREAEAKLTAMGFKLLPPKRMMGEKDWVYGIMCHGRHVTTGEQISVDTPLTLIIGNGSYDDTEDIDYTDPSYTPDDIDPDEPVPTQEPRIGGKYDENAVDDSGLSDF